MESSARNNALSAILMLLVVVPFAVTTGDIYIDPLDPGFSARDFPIGVISLTVLLAVVLLARSVREMRRQRASVYVAGEIDDTIRYVVPMAAVGFLYVWFIEMFQYALPTLLATVAALAMFGNRGRARLVVAPFVATIVYYVLFYGLLNLHEAPGTVLEYDNHHYFRPLRDALGLF